MLTTNHYRKRFRVDNFLFSRLKLYSIIKQKAVSFHFTALNKKLILTYNLFNTAIMSHPYFSVLSFPKPEIFSNLNKICGFALAIAIK